MELPFSVPSKNSPHVDDASFSKSSSSKPISLVGRHCYPFFRDHLHNPYPTSQEKESIVSQANSPDVTLVSVSNWFANSRRRSGWIELCNEYYNGDTKLMVEICSHVLINRGKSRGNDPLGLVDKILDMERKVQGWHEEEIKPDRWVLDLCDLIDDFKTRLRLITKNESPTSALPADECEDQETHSVVGVKRSHKDYLLGSHAFDTPDTLSRSASVSSISSLLSLTSDCYSSEEEERPIKRGRTNSRLEGDKKRSADPLSKDQSTHVVGINQLKRRFSASSFEDYTESGRSCKRFRITDDKLLEGSNPSTVQTGQPLGSSSPNAVFQPTVHDTELDISLLPTVDLQPPDASWSLDIDLYDWSSSPDILLMMDPNRDCQLNRDESFSAFATTITRTKMDDSDQWLHNLLMVDLPESGSLPPVQSESDKEQATPISSQTSDSFHLAPLTFTLTDTTTLLPNLNTSWMDETPCHQSDAELKLLDKEGKVLFGSDTLEENIRCWLSGFGLELDQFPAELPETFLLGPSCTTSSPVANII